MSIGDNQGRASASRSGPHAARHPPALHMGLPGYVLRQQWFRSRHSNTDADRGPSPGSPATHKSNSMRCKTSMRSTAPYPGSAPTREFSWSRKGSHGSALCLKDRRRLTPPVSSRPSSHNLNNGTAGQTFDSLPASEDGSTLALYQFDKNRRRYLILRSLALLPRPESARPDQRSRFLQNMSGVVGFRRLRPDTTYRRSPVPNPDGQSIPVLGVQGGNLVTIPFFAKERVDTTLHSMDEQTDAANVQTVPHDASGNEVQHYFGCWLDINQSGTKLFPLNPAGDGPYGGTLNSIFDLVRNQHQCLLTEIAFDPEPISGNPSPAVSDKLAQRNLSLNPTPNPGNGNSRRIASTFELKPTPLKLRQRNAGRASHRLGQHARRCHGPDLYSRGECAATSSISRPRCMRLTFCRRWTIIPSNATWAASLMCQSRRGPT